MLSLPFVLVLDHQIAFPDIFILMHDKVPQTDTRIKIQVAHRQGLLKDIPKSLLRVLQEKIGIEGEFTFVRRWAMLNWNLTSEFLAVGLLPIGIPPIK
mgnify:CR=1 FL=1